MRVHGWLCVSVILNATLSSALCEPTAAQSSQQPQTVRQTGGWQPSNTPAGRNDFSSESNSGGSSREPSMEPVVQTAYFQGQGSLSDTLPPFPAGSGAVIPPVQPLPNLAPPQLPTGTPNFANTNAPGELASGELRSFQNERQSTQQESGLRGQTQQVFPPQQTSVFPPQQTGGAQTNSTLPVREGTRLEAQNITTGYPFVTPPPRGRYATAPYQPAVFQATYQPPAIPVHLASTSLNGPQALALASVQPQQYLTPQQSNLPQFQYPQPGIYSTAYQCTTPAPSFPSTGAVPGPYIPPTLPPNLTPGLYTPNNAGYTPLFSLGQENYNVQLGRGVIGQPTVYVAGQPIRNFMRYLSP